METERDAVSAEQAPTPDESTPPILSGAGLRRRGAARWALTGGLRVLYRRWTRLAVALFPEDSARARWASQMGVPLPDRLNMSWVTPQLAVGGRVRPEDIGDWRARASRAWWIRARSTRMMRQRWQPRTFNCSSCQRQIHSPSPSKTCDAAPRGSTSRSRMASGCWCTASMAWGAACC